jgi:hypothetical protein
MSHCRLVTSKWSLQLQGVSKAREQELCEGEEFWKPLLAAGAQTVRFSDSMQSAIEIIKPLVEGPAFKPLLIKEVIEQKKPLPQTQAGQVVNDDVEEAHKAFRAEVADLKADEAEARIKKDTEYEKQLRDAREELEAKIVRLEEDKRLLAEPMPKSSGRFGRWIARAGALIVGGFMTAASGGALFPAAALLYGATETGAQLHRASS